MRLFDWLRTLGAAFAHPARAALTLLGLVIGSGSIVLLASLLHSAEAALIAANQQATDSDLIEVRTDEVPTHQRERTRRELTRADGETLDGAAALGGARVATEGRRQGVATVAGKRKNVGLTSGTPSTRELYRLQVEHGRFLTAEDVERRGRVAVLGQEIFQELYGGLWDGSEKIITVESETFVIVGVLAHKAYIGATTGTWIWDRKLLVPATTYDALFAPNHQVERLFVKRPTGPLAMPREALQALVRSSILRRHFGVENFKLREPDGDKQEKLVVGIVEGLLLGTGLLALLASGINIMNVMLVTVTERTREIGIRCAMGAKRHWIWGQFVLESATMAFFGGLAGCLAGLGIAWLGSYGLGKVFPVWEFHVVPWSLGAGLGLAVVTGVVFGLFPAWRASRLDPITALRYE